MAGGHFEMCILHSALFSKSANIMLERGSWDASIDGAGGLCSKDVRLNGSCIVHAQYVYSVWYGVWYGVCTCAAELRPRQVRPAARGGVGMALGAWP